MPKLPETMTTPPTATATTATTAIDAAALKQIMVAYGQALNSHREAIDSLNVFPVPDGDTGTNMALTVVSVLEHVESSAGGAAVASDLAELCQAISHGSLMGARGNSGVILSQILRGLCQSFQTHGCVDAASLASGWEAAREAAYEAVLEPREGTILTVLSDIAAQAAQCHQQGDDLLAMAHSCREAGQQSLARTPELLEVLAEAGVVDAGGAGLVLLWDAVLLELAGIELPPAPELAGAVAVGQAQPDGGHHGHGSLDAGETRYEVMFFLELPSEKAAEAAAEQAAISQFRQSWAELGDSIVVVGGDGLWNCHIHTNQIGESIEAGIEVGRPRQIRITDLFEQVDHLESDMQQSLAAALAGEPADGSSGSDAIWRNPAADPAARCAVVAVAAGSGIVKLLGELNVHSVVLGGQTMNPSTELLLEAVEAVGSPEVVLLPNNKNIIPVAEQAAQASTKEVHVLPSVSIPEGVAAMVMYDPSQSAVGNRKVMEAEVADLVVGQVTEAVRETSVGGQAVALGDYLGLSGGEIVTVSQQLDETVCGLLAEVIDPEHTLLMLYVGEPADSATTQAVQDWLAQQHPQLEVELHAGNQPLYHYYLGLF